MTHRSGACLALLVAVVLGCKSDKVVAPVVTPAPAAPTLASGNAPVLATVGVGMSYDASKGGTVFSTYSGTTYTYSLSIEGATNGLKTNGAIVSGTPTSSALTWITVTITDGLARSASDRFAVVAMSAELQVPTLPTASYSYSDANAPLPAHFTVPINGVAVTDADNTPADNAITNAGATLGRVLFYDMRVSANDGLSCAGCHSPFIGFTDRLQLSVGFNGGITGRHSPAIVNARFYKRGKFFWDERAPTLEAQVLRPIQDATEMGMTLDNLVTKLSVTAYYPPLFAAAFGSSVITSDRIARALAQYVRSLVSGGSRYDKAYSANGASNFASTLTAQESQGEALFRTTGCASCHITVAQISDSIHNIGLDLVSADTGAGRGAFKTPSLRNVAIRPRFMHDGRFASLEDVVDFFDSGVQANANLDTRMRAADGTPKRLSLTSSQKSALVAFLNTLTDSTFLSAPRFANPFAAATSPLPLPTPQAVTVTIQSTAYHPATITVAPSAIVSWVNLDNARHSASFTTSAVGATPIFNSGSQSLTMPAVRGTYNYQCAIHGSAMRGTVIVQ